MNIKNELLVEKVSKIKGGIYHFSQVNFAYNSNKIEGSKLTSDETEAIFTTSFIDKDSDLVKNHDIIETKNHFRLFDYMLDIVDDELSIDNILMMHKILKSNIGDNIGCFKKTPNVIGLINVVDTTEPDKVEDELRTLLDEYNSKDNIKLEDIIDFHYRFERIHPFDDGNGRVGRIIMFKECLRNGIMPFIVLHDDKHFYIRGLNNYKSDKMYLIDTIGHEQDIYQKIYEDLID